MIICFFGASSVEGACDSQWGGFVRRYTDSAMARGAEVRVFNSGVGGDTTRNFRARFTTEIVARQPEKIVFQLGSNDMPRTPDEEPERRVSQTEFEENLHALFGFQPETPKLLITLFPIDPVRTGITPKTFHTYVETSKRIAEEYAIEILDIYARLGGVCHAELLAEDGLHLNPQGYAWLTEQLLPLLP